MSITEIRTALHVVHDAVEVPPVDRLEFQRRVRSARRRRTTGRVLAGTAAAVAVATGVALMGDVTRSGDRPMDGGIAGDPGATGRVSESIYFSRAGRLTALDPLGRVHDLGIPVRAIVGWTSERVYAIDAEGMLVIRAVTYADEASAASYAPDSSPARGPVLSAALSDDGRYLAWQDMDRTVRRYNLEADRQDLVLPAEEGVSVVSVSAEGVLLAGDARLEIHTGDAEIAVPVDDVEADGQLALGQVFADSGSSWRLFRLVDGTLDEAAFGLGDGRLAPYAERVAVIGPDDTGRVRVQVWDGRPGPDPAGLEGVVPAQVRWADETTLLVAGQDAGGAGLWVCGIDLACGRLPVDGEIDLDR